MRQKHDREFCNVVLRLGVLLLKKFTPQLTWNTTLIVTYGIALFVCLQFAMMLMNYNYQSGEEVHFLPLLSSDKLCVASEVEVQPRSILVPVVRSTKPATLVVYNFYPSEGANNNLAFFLRHALHSRPDTHFLLVLSANPCVTIPEQSNLGIIKSPASCYGYCAIYKAIMQLGAVEKYAHFIVLGSWVRGPFMPTWTNECWTDSFTHHLSIPLVHMTGTTHSCNAPDGRFKPHLHPTAWAFKGRSVLEILKPFDHSSTKEAFQELQMSTVMMAHIRGWNVAALAPGWRNYSAADACGPGPKFQPHPYETIFVNTRLSSFLKVLQSTRDLAETTHHLQLATKAAELRGYDSNHVCR